MSENLFLAMSENKQLEFIKKYAEDHKNMTQDERRKFCDLIGKEKKIDDSEYYYGKHAIFLLSDKVYEAILKNICLGCDMLLLSNLFFGYGWDCFDDSGKIIAKKFAKKEGENGQFVESKTIDQDKFSRFFVIFLRQLNNFQKAFLQTKMLEWPNLFYMFPTDVQNELNKNLGLNFEVKNNTILDFEAIYKKHNNLFIECSYDVTGDGHCAVRSANMGYRIYKGNYYKNKKIEDDMTWDQCIALRKEAYKYLTDKGLKYQDMDSLIKKKCCEWTRPELILVYFDERDKENGNESVPYFSLGVGEGNEFQSHLNLEKNTFASILNNCIVANQVNKNHFRCLKEDYKTRKKYLIGFCDILCDLASTNILCDDDHNFDITNIIAQCLLAPLWDIKIVSNLLRSCVPEEEINKIRFSIKLILSTFAAEQKCFVAVKLIEFIYGQYKKALEKNKWNEITAEKISKLTHEFRKVLESDKSLTKVSRFADENNSIYQIDPIQKMFVDDDIENKIFFCNPNFEQNNDEYIKSLRSQALAKWTSGKKTKQYLQQRVNDYSYFFYTLDQVSIKMFLEKNIFPWQKFNIYNDQPDIQILALENMDEETKKILLDAFEKDNNFFDGCADDVKKKLIELGIIFDEKVNDNKKINEQSLNEFEIYLSDLKNNFPGLLKDYEKKLADIKKPEKLGIDIKDFADEINKLKNEIEEKIKLAKQRKLDEEKDKAKKENEDKKKNLKLVKNCALAIAGILGNKKACEMIYKLTADELNNFYNKNKDVLENAKAELCKPENMKKLGLKQEGDFLSDKFEFDKERINNIVKNFSVTSKDKLWFAGLGIGEAASVALGTSMIFIGLPVIAIGSGTVAIGLLAGMIYKIFELKQKSSERKGIFDKIKTNETKIKSVIGSLDTESEKIK